MAFPGAGACLRTCLGAGRTASGPGVGPDVLGSPATGAAGLGDVLREGRAHALTLTSSEGLDNLCALLAAEDLERLRRVPAFVPHPRIAEHARTLGFVPVETGGADAGLIAGLLEWFGRHPLG